MSGPTKTLQEIFDFGLNHIRQQGMACVDADKGGTCAYRNAAGQSCIVGGFFTAETYDPEFDQSDSGVTSVAQLVERCDAFNLALDEVGVDTEDSKVVNLLRGMQECHDGCASTFGDEFRQAFAVGMQRLADKLGLKYKPPSQ